MAYAFVIQRGAASTTNQSSLAPAAWTPSAGNHIIAMTQCTSASTGIAISDNQSNNYVQVAQVTPSGSIFTYTVWEAGNVAGSSTTVTGSVGTGGIRGCYVREDSGLPASAYVTGSFASTRMSPGNTNTDAITLSAMNATLVPAALVAFCIDETSTSHVMVGGTGFTGRGALWSAGNTLELCEDKRVTATGNNTPTFTAGASGGSDNYVLLAAYFTEINVVTQISPFTLYGLQPTLAQ